MISNQILQSTIDGIKGIARVDVCVMDIEGKIVIPQKYHNGGIFSNGLVWVQESVQNNDTSMWADEATGGKIGYVNKSGETVIPFIYDEATNFDGEYASVKKEGKCRI